MTGVIDAHSHIYPRSYIELLKQRSIPPRIVETEAEERFVIFDHEEQPGRSGGRLFDTTYWDPWSKLEYMDRFGIHRSIVSLGNPWLDPFSPSQGVDVAAMINEELGALEGETDGRLLGQAVIPPDVEAAVTVLDQVVSRDSLYGVAGGTRICGRPPDDPALDPLWAALEEHDIPLSVHPHYGLREDTLSGPGLMLPLALGFPFETTAAVARLVLSGVLQRFPGVRILAGHGGGTLPFLAGRLDAVWRTDAAARQGLPTPPSEDLARIALDGLVYSASALRTAVDLVGAERVMFGTDHPFCVADPQCNLAAVEALGPKVADSVRRRSAEAFFRLRPTIAAERKEGPG